MSRLAKKPIIIPTGVTITEDGNVLNVQGPKGVLHLKVPSDIRLTIGATEVSVASRDTSNRNATEEGTTWSLLRNAIEGVTQGFVKALEIEGVGYKAALEGTTLVLSLGFVNPRKIVPPEGIKIIVEKNIIKVEGISKEVVGQIAAEIRSHKKPEPYKGKGIHYVGEVIRRKVGKKAGVAAA